MPWLVSFRCNIYVNFESLCIERWSTCTYVRGGVSGAFLDTADALAIDDSGSDVAILAPACAPRVLDEPVLLATLRAVADCEHGVIERGATGGCVKNS